MRVLAVETSTLAGGAALLDGELVVGEYALDVSVTHSERLMGAIDRLLTDAGWTVRDLEGLAVSVGPGSFTGLRIGLSTVKGLALALSIPIVAVPTLDAMAALLPFAALPVCPVLDARKREVYASLYRWDGAGMHRVWEYLAIAPATKGVAHLLGEIKLVSVPATARSVRAEKHRISAISLSETAVRLMAPHRPPRSPRPSPRSRSGTRAGARARCPSRGPCRS